MEDLTYRLVRLEEQIHALKEVLNRVETERDKAINAASADLARRLEHLNHANEKAVQDKAQFITRTEIRWFVGLIVSLLLAVIGLYLRHG